MVLVDSACGGGRPELLSAASLCSAANCCGILRRPAVSCAAARRRGSSGIGLRLALRCWELLAQLRYCIVAQHGRLAWHRVLGHLLSLRMSTAP